MVPCSLLRAVDLMDHERIGNYKCPLSNDQKAYPNQLLVKETTQLVHQTGTSFFSPKGQY